MQALWRRQLWIAGGLLVGIGWGAPLWAGDAFPAGLRGSIVKIYTTFQSENYAQPWQAGNVKSGSGSGFIIAKRRLITNAHVVSDARFIEVQREGDPQKYPARVAFIGHDCDLALLSVDDPGFFVNARPLVLSSHLPQLNNEVLVLGYPMGGTRISITRGVVSRIDYHSYVHSGVDTHLVLQVDAAINPGNSGGPVLFAGQVVGLAFQGIMGSQNIGYAIPLPVIEHFLEDIADDVYHGYPELGVEWADTRNPALRRALQLDATHSGVVLNFIDPFGSAQGILQAGDVLLDIDGYPVANDGSIMLDGHTVEFVELLERKQWGAAITCRIWRQGAEQQLTITLANPPDPFCFRQLYDSQPEYLMIQGLVFAPLTRNYLAEINANGGAKVQALHYYQQFAKRDGLYTNRTQFVTLIARLPHPVNTYHQPFVNGVVTEVNQRPIGSLRDLQAALEQPTNGFQVIRFEDSDTPLVLATALSAAADREISQQYHVPALMHFEDQPAAEAAEAVADEKPTE